MTTKISQGRQMNEEHEAFSAYLISLFKPKDSKEFDNIIAKLSEKEISDLYKQFKTMEGVTFAKMGAKLDYLQRLNGKCPEGYEIEKYMAGGCVKCRKKMLKNTPLMDMCGGKVKKRIKKAESGDKAKVINTEKLTPEFKNDKPKRERVIRVEKLTPGGPGMSDSTRGAKLNPKQSKATNNKKRI